MKHAFLKAAIAACFACAAVTVSAANPFTDVSADDWAYQAVASLSDEGVIDGYPDGTFRGDKHVTRYEIPQIVARLMAKEDTLNASQKETLAKLSSQYANELKDLGVASQSLKRSAAQPTSSLSSASRASTAMTMYSKETSRSTMKSLPAPA